MVILRRKSLGGTCWFIAIMALLNPAAQRLDSARMQPAPQLWLVGASAFLMLRKINKKMPKKFFVFHVSYIFNPPHYKALIKQTNVRAALNNKLSQMFRVISTRKSRNWHAFHTSTRETHGEPACQPAARDEALIKYVLFSMNFRV